MKRKGQEHSLFSFEVPLKESGRVRRCSAPDFGDTSPLKGAHAGKLLHACVNNGSEGRLEGSACDCKQTLAHAGSL